jgi:hypothetical protein
VSSRYRVEFELVGNAGNIDAVLNRLNNGISRVGGSSRQATNEMGLWQRQMMAMSTTARYALAGGVVFGVTAAVGALSQFERGWGQVMALMSGIDTRRGFQQASTDISALTSYALQASNSLATASDQVQSVIQQAYSAFQIPQGQRGIQQVEKFTDAVVKLGAVAESTDLNQLSQGVIGFSMSMGRGLQDVPRFASMLSQVSRISLFRGSELSQFIGQIGAGGVTARMKPAEVLALLTAVSLGGGSQAMAARGVSQLTGRSLLFPQTPGQKNAYGQAGLPTDPATLVQMGGANVLLRLFNAVHAAGGLGISGAGRAMTDEQIASLGDNASAASLGISGRGTALARNFFGRIESFRAFTLAYQILAQDARQHHYSLNDAFKRFVTQINNAGKSTKTLDDQFKAFLSQSQLSQASIAIHNMTMGLVRNVDPLLHPLARGVTGVSNLSLRHPHVVGALEGALFAGLGARTIGKFVPGGSARLLRLFGRGTSGVASGAAGAALAGEAATNLLSGGATDGTRANPFWVIIHPASWYAGSPGGFGGPVNSPIPGGPGRLPNRMPRVPFGPVGATAAALSGLLLEGYGIQRFVSGAMNKGAPTPLVDAFLRNATVARDSPFAKRYPGLRNLFQQYADSNGGMTPQMLEARLAGNPAALGFAGWRRVQTRAERMAAQRAVQYVSREAGDQAGAFAVDGNLSGEFTVHLVDKQGNEIGVQLQKGVPVKLWGARAVPQHRGKPKDTRKGR